MDKKINVAYTDNAQTAFNKAKSYLFKDKINNNIFISILEERIKFPQPGNYWCIEKDEQVVGFALQSPVYFQMNVSEMKKDALEALSLKIKEQNLQIPAFFGVADTVTALEKIWKKINWVSIIPTMRLQYYYLDKLKTELCKNEAIRTASKKDFEKVKELILNFYDEINEKAENIDQLLLHDIESKLIWVYEHENRITSILRYTIQSRDAIRIKNVYTPIPDRNKGYGTCLVSCFCKSKENHTIMLFTDAVNPAANTMYQKIGFKHKNNWARYSINYLANDIE